MSTSFAIRDRVPAAAVAAGAGSIRDLRRQLRAARRLISPPQQRRHAAALALVLGRELRFRQARRIAAYWPADGELDPGPLLARPHHARRYSFLPVLRPGRQRRLWFVRHEPGASLKANRLGIPEPRRGRHAPTRPWTLDLILVPLVGFDAAGNRLGMGGGYYDRTLSFLRRRAHWVRPRLIGIAHECQRVDRLLPRPWDVPLDAVATEQQVYRRHTG